MRDELIAAIEADPDDLENYRVYADWLESNGQPRGQLIQLELLRERLTDRAKLDHLDRKIAVYVHTHRAALLNGLASWPHARYDLSRTGELVWRRGYIRRAMVADHDDPAKRLRDLIASPSGRFLVELELRTDVLDVLLQRVPASLRALELVLDRIDLEPAWPMLARLHRLSLNLNTPNLITIDLPELRMLTINGNVAVNLEQPITPKLDTLAFYDVPRAETIVKLLDRLDAPVTKLVFEHVMCVDDVVGRLADTRIGRQLTEVTMPRARYFTDEGVRQWLEHPPAQKLARIDVRESVLSERSFAALRSIAREIAFTARTYL